MIRRIFLAGALCLTAALQPVLGIDDEETHLKPGDLIKLSVFGEPDLAKEVQLTGKGEASFELIGTVKLSGLTLKQAEELATRLYNADYLVEPTISINVVDAAKERVSVLGAVNAPGEVGIFAKGLDLVSAIGTAGGPLAHANLEKVELKRGGKTTVYNLAVLQRPGAQQIPLAHGDTVNIPVNPYAFKTITISGEVVKPGEVKFPLDGHLDLVSLVAAAGGFTEKADLNRIAVRRAGALVSVNSRLQPGDLVSVPASRFVGKFVTVTGQVARPGEIAFPLNGDLTALGAVSRAGGFGRLANKKKVRVTRGSQSWLLNLEDRAKGKAQPFQLLPGDSLSVDERIF